MAVCESRNGFGVGGMGNVRVSKMEKGLVASLLLLFLSLSFVEQTSQSRQTCCCPCCKVLWQTQRVRLWPGRCPASCLCTGLGR